MKIMDIAENYWEWLEIDGHRYKLLEMAKNCRQWLEMAGNGRKWLAIALMAGKGWK